MFTTANTSTAQTHPHRRTLQRGGRSDRKWGSAQWLWPLCVTCTHSHTHLEVKEKRQQWQTGGKVETQRSADHVRVFSYLNFCEARWSSWWIHQWMDLHRKLQWWSRKLLCSQIRWGLVVVVIKKHEQTRARRRKKEKAASLSAGGIPACQLFLFLSCFHYFVKGDVKRKEESERRRRGKRQTYTVWTSRRVTVVFRSSWEE